jgi:hypothetical protein
LHLHTTFSDGELSLAELKDHFQAKGFQFLLMSDHAEGMDGEKMRAYVAQCRALSDDRFLIVPGLEFAYPSKAVPGSSHLHLLGFGIARYERAKDPVGMIHTIHRLGGLAVLAHPYPAHAPDYAELAPLLDGIELWNTKYNGRFAPALWNYVLLQQIQRRGSKTFGFYGTDFHWKTQYAGMVVSVEAEQLAAPVLLASLSNGKFHAEKGGMVLTSDGTLTAAQQARFASTERLYRIWKTTVVSGRLPFKVLHLTIPRRLKAISRKVL